MVSKGKSVFKGIVFSWQTDELRTSVYKDFAKTLGIVYLDLESIISLIKQKEKDLEPKE